MNGFLQLLRKEMVEAVRTRRLPVLGGVALFFALTGPFLALLTPQILESMQSSQPGVIIQVPDPTWRDAYAQWAKNLSQIVSFIVIISGAGSVASEVSSGTATLVLTKPVSRRAFIAAKALALFALVATTVLVATAVTQGVTALVFGEAPWGEVWGSALAWTAFAALLVAIAVALSAVVSTLAAAGIGVAVFFGMSITGIWESAVRYSPVGLTLAPAELVAGRSLELGWPLVTTAVASVVLVIIAGESFARRDL